MKSYNIGKNINLILALLKQSYIYSIKSITSKVVTHLGLKSIN